MKATRTMSRRELALLAAALLVPIPVLAASGVGGSLPQSAHAGLASITPGGGNDVSTGDVSAGPASGRASGSPKGRGDGHLRIFGKRRHTGGSRPVILGGLGAVGDDSSPGGSSAATSQDGGGAGADGGSGGSGTGSSEADGSGSGGTGSSGGGTSTEASGGGGSATAGNGSNNGVGISATGQGTSADGSGGQDGALLTLAGPNGSGGEATGGTPQSGDGISVHVATGDAGSGTGVGTPSTGIGLP